MKSIPDQRVGWTAALLFGSGCCALVYQMAWLRELRLVFGGSTAASGVVLAIFMGGLGMGSAVLGPRSDRHPSPLGFYARLEIMIALAALLTPFLLIGVRSVYVTLGGSSTMGMFGSTLIRIALASVVLGVPSFLMGGTLPAAVKAVETHRDVSRRAVGVLYSSNTLGAVCGVSLATFVFLEHLGTRQTLWVACLFNLLLGVVARVMARRWLKVDPAAEPGAKSPHPSPGVRPSIATPAPFVFAAACLSGFSFSVMELVWYRLLGPILGGSTYTFGIILIVALAGIAAGGLVYALRSHAGQASPGTFALACALAALVMAIPFALGDRIAILTGLLQDLGNLGLHGRVLSWTIIAGIVVFPAYLVSGFQFPLLINLLGRGSTDVARHTGVAYAWNTAGAIAGSLGGVFFLIPWLSATVVWQGVVILLGLLAMVAAIMHGRLNRNVRMPAVVCALLLLAGGMLTASGPTAVWRHSGIGAGRGDVQMLEDINRIQDWSNAARRQVIWEAEGREASVAILRDNGLAFAVNGKSDGNVTADAMTQVMLGLVGAALHPEPRASLVIGLGTGCSAGWLAEIESMERVDVAEIESGTREMARRCAPANYHVLDHPKANLIIGDGREILLTSRDTYDLIVSEPSNPYRAGISSLYTIEFYEAVSRRMNAGGLFSQWLQAYEVDTQTVQTIYATLRAVFPVVETWVLQEADLLFVCSMNPLALDASALRERLGTHPFSTALEQVWRARGLEGFLGHYLANPAFTDAVSAGQPWVNTDDRMRVEYAFARTVGRKANFAVDDLGALARVCGDHRPPYLRDDGVNWQLVDNAALMLRTCSEVVIPPQEGPNVSRSLYANALNRFLAGDWRQAVVAWQEIGEGPTHPLEVALLGEGLAAMGDEAALANAEALVAYDPVASDLILARYHLQTGNDESARLAVERALLELRRFPWVYPPIAIRGFDLIERMVNQNPDLAPSMLELLDEPFAVGAFHEIRTQLMFNLAYNHDQARAYEIIRALEPHPTWNLKSLQFRHNTYRDHADPLQNDAERDLRRFLQNYGPTVHESLIGVAVRDGTSP